MGNQHARAAGRTPGVSRRQFLAGSGLAAAGVLGLAALEDLAAAGPAARSLVGYRDYAMAMHIHASFSEGRGSMQAQLSEAAANKVDVLWWTEHDWRMSAHGYRAVVHFDSLTEESEAGRPWLWQPQVTGSPATVGGGIVTSPASPGDPGKASALRVLCAAGSKLASYRYYANAGQARMNQRANITGQTISVDVFPLTVGPDAWLEVLLTLSTRPALAGRKSGSYQLSYRFGAAAAGHRLDSGSPLLGIIDVPVTPGSYQTVVLDPTADVAALWPDLVAPGDNGLFDLWLGATAQAGATAEGFFDHLVFSRSMAAGQNPVAVQAGLITAYGPLFPQVAQIAAQEASYFDQHVNLFGGDVGLADYSAYANVWSNTPNGEFTTYLSELVHGSGGLSSYNHPFGPAESTNNPLGDQVALRHKVLTGLLPSRAHNVDIIELGYRQRGGATLDTHLALGDALWRNGFLITATGVSDDHTGAPKQWGKNPNRFITSAWADSAGEADLLQALRTGRAYSTELKSGVGSLDLIVDEIAPMGSVSVRPKVANRTLQLSAAALPAGCTVEVVQGPVDYPGTTDLEPGTHVVATFPAAAFAGGVGPTLQLDTSQSSFVRAAVVSAAGNRIGFTNPIWLLHETARSAVPAERKSPDSR